MSAFRSHPPCAVVTECEFRCYLPATPCPPPVGCGNRMRISCLPATRARGPPGRRRGGDGSMPLLGQRPSARRYCVGIKSQNLRIPHGKPSLPQEKRSRPGRKTRQAAPRAVGLMPVSKTRGRFAFSAGATRRRGFEREGKNRGFRGSTRIGKNNGAIANTLRLSCSHLAHPRNLRFSCSPGNRWPNIGAKVDTVAPLLGCTGGRGGIHPQITQILADGEEHRRAWEQNRFVSSFICEHLRNLRITSFCLAQ